MILEKRKKLRLLPEKAQTLKSILGAVIIGIDKRRLEYFDRRKRKSAYCDT